MTRLSDIRARLAAATPQNIWGGTHWESLHDDDGEGWGQKPLYCVGINGVGHWPVAWVYKADDAELIAHSVSDLTYTLEHIERLEAALRQADEWLAGWASAEPYRATIKAVLSHPEGDGR